MIEDYGTLSEEELIAEIKKQLEDNEGIDASDLEFKYEDERLFINGTLQNDEELEVLVGILENYVDPKDYEMDVELIEASDPDVEERRARRYEEDEDDEEEELEEEELLKEDLEEGEAEAEEDEIEFEDEEDEGGFDDEKW
jgi:hypothetical protein